MGEPLVGTASRVDLWLVLEVPGAWGAEVEDLLPAAADRMLKPALQAVPRSRVLFVKGPPRRRGDQLQFYVAVTDELEPRLYRFDLESYDALAHVDVFGVLAEEECWSSYRDPDPLYLVCTHGAHDRCCAKFGFPVYQSLARAEPRRVWQCSHVGGDRFAANVVCLPAGLYYGHVNPAESEALLASTREGRLLPARWRGRACYTPAVQAAEHLLREVTGEWALSAFRLCSRKQRGDITEAEFLALDAGDLHALRVEAIVLEGRRALTCGTPEAKPVRGFRLLEHRVAPLQPETGRAAGVAFRLEPAAMRDYAFIYRLRRETLHPHLQALAMEPEEQVRFCAAFDVARHRLIRLGESRAGALSVLERSNSLHLANLHILPEYQRGGLGTALVRDLQSQADRQGRPITTEVLKVSPARGFYERLGFRVAGEQGLRYRMLWEP